MIDMTALSQTVDATLAPLRARAQHEGVLTDPSFPPPPPNPARAVQSAVGPLMGALALPTQLANTGVAMATNAISDVLPQFPAATMGSLYVGIPHAHLHPPSLIPPAPPVPLPSLGAIMLGTSVQVLINGMPAARAGDLGIAPTCAGFAPFFTVFLGSSKVFIGGTRAARMTDICTACTPSAAPFVRAASAALRAAAKVHQAASTAAMVAGIAADLTDAATGSEEVAAASALSATMAAAQVAADMAASALSASMGTDPAVPPHLPGFVMVGMPNVLVAGMPFPNIPDLASLLFKRARGRPARRGGRRSRRGAGAGCPS